jgi:hypothetical protein
LLTLFSRRSRRFSADSLTEAYREGDALRLVFGTRDRHEILAVWARGGEVAAEIVKLLPTLRTVELDHSTDPSRRYRFDWRTAMLLLILAVLAAVGISLLLRLSDVEFEGPPPELVARPLPGAAPPVSEPAPDSSGTRRANPVTDARGSSSVQRPAPLATSPGKAPTSDSQAEPGASQDTAALQPVDEDASYTPVESGAPSTPAVAGYASVPEPMSSYDAAVLMLRMFEVQSSREIDDDGWWQFTVRIHTTPEFQARDLWIIREAMLAVSRAWRAHDAEFARKLTDQLHQIIR